ncbi:MAG: hypothetical protein PHH00_03915 [Candidatus Nanoarchaeia archaeon]|nr:hypothetical protein [Candidatus Nanoarchaeia archaeon]
MGYEGLALVGAHFAGEFLADRERVLKSLRGARKARTSPADVELEKYIASLERDLGPREFEMRIHHFDTKSGLFVAVGNDDFGHSGIIGRVEPDRCSLLGNNWFYGISFTKTYPMVMFEHHNRRPNFSRNFREFEYWGEIDEKHDIKGGIYVPRNGVTGSGGTWQMKLKPGI